MYYFIEVRKMKRKLVRTGLIVLTSSILIFVSNEVGSYFSQKDKILETQRVTLPLFSCRGIHWRKFTPPTNAIVQTDYSEVKNWPSGFITYEDRGGEAGGTIIELIAWRPDPQIPTVWQKADKEFVYGRFYNWRINNTVKEMLVDRDHLAITISSSPDLIVVVCCILILTGIIGVIVGVIILIRLGLGAVRNRKKFRTVTP
jgi:hypothetical protein